eukprot:PhF_6_TR42666/c0_g1_i4/m.64303
MSIIVGFLLLFVFGGTTNLAAAQLTSSCITPGGYPYPLGPAYDGRMCMRGFLCKNLTLDNNRTYPSMCPPTLDCALMRLARSPCEPQGWYEPMICPAGSECPDMHTQKPCPAGYWCTDGTYSAKKCSYMSYCPEGSETERDLSSLFFAVVADILVFVIYKVYRFIEGRRSMNHRDYILDKYPEIELRSRDDVNSDEDTDPKVAQNVSEVCKGFKRARGPVPHLEFRFKDLSLSIPIKDNEPPRKVLAGVTGCLRPGTVTAIMGPSGAGKTTFFNVLLGKVDDSWVRGGSLTINGEDIAPSTLRQLIGFVPQEDIMPRDLSVWQNIAFSGNMRLPAAWTSEQRKSFLSAVLSALNLHHVKDTKIGDEFNRGVSGGQRKRANIGLEVAGAPAAIFLDEPTSGLDSTQAMSVVNMLNVVAKTTNTTIAMVIHQPRIEIWQTLDSLLLLAPGGRTAYLGPQKHAEAYFKTVIGLEIKPWENPADAIMDCIAVQADRCVALWKKQQDAFKHKSEDVPPAKSPVEPADDESDQGGQAGQMEPSDHAHNVLFEVESDAGVHDIPNMLSKIDQEVRGASFFTQVYRCHVRSIVKQIETLPTLWLEIGVALLAGGIMGIAGQSRYAGVYRAPYTLLSPSPSEDVIPQMAMYIMMSIGIAASPAGVRTFGEEMTVYWREAAVGHNRLAYFLGVSTAAHYRIVIGALHFSMIYHILATPIISFPRMYVIVLMTYLAVYTQSEVISMILRPSNAPLLAVVLSLTFATINGYVRNFPIWLKRISYTFYASEALYTDSTAPFDHIYELQSVSAPIWEYTIGWYDYDIACLVALCFGYRIVAYFCMIWLNRDKQR